jgi:hypothetical protein
MQVKYGESLSVVGNLPVLGDWDVDKALQLRWHEKDVWSAELAVPVGVDVEFKVCRAVLCSRIPLHLLYLGWEAMH